MGGLPQLQELHAGIEGVQADFLPGGRNVGVDRILTGDALQAVFDEAPGSHEAVRFGLFF